MLIALHYIESANVGDFPWQPFDDPKHNRGHEWRVAIVRPGSVAGQDGLHGGVVVRVVQLLDSRHRRELFVVVILTLLECVSVYLSLLL